MNTNTSIQQVVISTDIVSRSNEWIAVAQQAYEYQLMIKDLEKKHKLAMDRLKILSEGKTSHGGGFLLAKEIRKGSISFQDIPVLAGMDLEPYRKTDVEYWKLSKIA